MVDSNARSSPLSAHDTAAFYWTTISSILPEATRWPTQTSHLFHLAEQVFLKNDENNRNEASLRAYLSSWTDMLLNHEHIEVCTCASSLARLTPVVCRS